MVSLPTYSKIPIIVITGATDGIGKALVGQLVHFPAKVIVIARNLNKYIDLLNEIRAQSICIPQTFDEYCTDEKAEIGFFQADLSLLSDVKRVAQEIVRCFPQVDILVNNVGGYFAKRTETKEGHELTFALNYLGPFLMSMLLLEPISTSSNGQILNISSSAHSMGKIDFDDLELKHRYLGLTAYSQSKLAGIVLTKELAKKFDPVNVRVNSMHPGIVKTNIAQGYRGIEAFLFKLLKYTVAISPKKAATRICEVLFDLKFRNLSGMYISETKIKKVQAITDDQGFRNKLMEHSWNIIYPNLDSPFKASDSEPYCWDKMETLFR